VLLISALFCAGLMENPSVVERPTRPERRKGNVFIAQY
jgi:hypothetical protein